MGMGDRRKVEMGMGEIPKAEMLMGERQKPEWAWRKAGIGKCESGTGKVKCETRLNPCFYTFFHEDFSCILKTGEI